MNVITQAKELETILKKCGFDNISELTDKQIKNILFNYLRKDDIKKYSDLLQFDYFDNRRLNKD